MPITLDSSSDTVIGGLLDFLNNNVEALRTLIGPIIPGGIVSINSTTICLLSNVTGGLDQLLNNTLGGVLGNVLGGDVLGGLTGWGERFDTD